jgi:alcohol dehydrogenase, propanol-preferring
MAAHMAAISNKKIDMRAMILAESHMRGQSGGPTRLQLQDVPKPQPGPGEVLVRVNACGVCRTDLHIVDRELSNPKLPLILGHQIVGRVEAIGTSITSPARIPQSEIRIPQFSVGDRVGIPWLGWTDGECAYCRSARENLCDRAKFTGYNIDGGYAEFAVADARYCFYLPDEYNDREVAPLLCAGLIGYRSYRKTGDARHLGLYGFGNAAHLIAQLAVHEKREVFAFTRPGDRAGQESARSLGAVWAGGSDELPPTKLDAAIIFASVGALVAVALRALAKGGVVVCGGIHMSDIPGFPYRDLWNERVITSVANLTRRDGEEFLSLAPRVPIKTNIQTFPLEEANVALDKFRAGELVGNAVLLIRQ